MGRLPAVCVGEADAELTGAEVTGEPDADRTVLELAGAGEADEPPPPVPPHALSSAADTSAPAMAATLVVFA